jgi:predicted small lipoprotein YifL
MQTSFPQIIRLTVVFAVIGLAVAGCGRKGDLDPPSVQATKGATRPSRRNSPASRTGPSSSIPFCNRQLQ